MFTLNQTTIINAFIAGILVMVVWSLVLEKMVVKDAYEEYYEADDDMYEAA